MDNDPFLVVDMLNLVDNVIDEINKFHKSSFDANNIFNSANDLKYINSIKTIISKEFKEPSEDFVKFFTSKIYDGRNTEKVISYFSEIIKKSFDVYQNEYLQTKFNNFVDNHVKLIVSEDEYKIETTELEIESYYAIKSILSETIEDLNRIKYKDTKIILIYSLIVLVKIYVECI